jgi:hypothetical protein
MGAGAPLGSVQNGRRPVSERKGVRKPPRPLSPCRRRRRLVKCHPDELVIGARLCETRNPTSPRHRRLRRPDLDGITKSGVWQ